ncbi:MAG: hypothetical protein FWG98_11575 [Candidatus Cloacimonetes bacterium]|nr:hypothetical protein [Candidatus Cloacimonadota bacterium]
MMKALLLVKKEEQRNPLSLSAKLRLTNSKTFYVFLFLWLFILKGLLGNFFVQDELTKVFNVSTGDIVNSSILLSNPTERAVSIRVYQGDYIQNSESDNLTVRAGSSPRSNAHWIRFQSSVTIPPNQTFSLPFTINIPNQSDLTGSFWSILFVEEVNEMDVSDPEIIVLNLRTGVQIINNIANTAQIDVLFSDFAYEVDYVSMILKNTGNLWLQASVKIDVYNDGAELVGSFVSERNRIYPEFSRRVQIPVNLQTNTNYHAIIVADCGNGNIFGHQISFIID